jgi:hypothetical protein
MRIIVTSIHNKFVVRAVYAQSFCHVEDVLFRSFGLALFSAVLGGSSILENKGRWDYKSSNVGKDIWKNKQ